MIAPEQAASHLDGREVRTRFQKSCAIAHGRGSGMSANELMDMVDELGLPSRAERERILREKLGADAEEGTTTTSSPSD